MPSNKKFPHRKRRDMVPGENRPHAGCASTQGDSPAETGCAIDADGGCACCHEEEDGESLLFSVVRLSVAAALLAGGIFLPINRRIAVVLLIAGYLAAGYSYLIEAVQNALQKRPFDETLLMTVATVGAAAIGEWREACLVMLLFGVGRLLEQTAVARSEKNISSLLDLKQDFVHLLRDGNLVTVAPEEAAAGERMVVRPYERFALDGVVEEGSGVVDSSMLTGESTPEAVSEGSPVLSGSVNGGHALTVTVTEPYSRSTVSRIIELTGQAAKNKAPSERFITKFARVYTPAVVFLALLTAVVPPVVSGLLTGQYPFDRWIYTALTFLIISCPCALVISVPLTYVAAIGGGSRQGILVKGADSLEALADAGCVVFDKTGTLTEGRFSVRQIVATASDPAEKVLAYAAHAEHASTHPIARAIVSHYDGSIRPSAVSNILETPGKGVFADFESHRLLVGNRGFLSENGIPLPGEPDGGVTAFYIAKDGVCIGYITAADTLKKDAAEAVSLLFARGMDVMMLTGDAASAAKPVAETLGIRRFHASLLPADKLRIVEELKGGRRKVIFAGDGINDAPVITAADIGISMGGLGSDAAIEAAGVVLMTDEPKRVVTALRIARRTRGIVLQNIVFSLGVKAAVMLLGVISAIPLGLAVAADVGVTVLAVINALRAMTLKP